MSETIRVALDGGGRETLSGALVDALAAAKGVEPQDLERPVYEYVDPGALDGLFDSSMPGITRQGTLSFPAGSFQVTIEVAADDTAEVRVEPRPAVAEESSGPTATRPNRA